ncbi:MAG TPA: hypothetical protein VIG80_12910 [Bacillaceae bacterium]
MRKWMILLLAALLVGGCSGKAGKEKKVEAEKAVNTPEPTDETKIKKTSSEGSADLTDIEKVKIPQTEEDLTAQEGGFFTKNIPYEEETKQKWGPFGLGDYEDELTEKLRAVTKEIQDPNTIFQALHYYVGSQAYGRAINELKEFRVEWYEPYLPEPGELEEKAGEKPVNPGKALILLDASSSMLLNIEGKLKMDVAKSAAGRFANTIGGTNDVSLIVYGHAGTQNDKDKELSCTTIDEVYPLSAFDAEKFTEAVNGVEAKGWTPIANAIKAAREKMSGSSDNVTLYIISDGTETCGGDPVAEAKAFAAEDSGRTVNIIGFDVDTAGENALKEVAAAGNGEYISAKTIDDLNNSIRKTWVPSFQEIRSKSNSLLKHWGQSFQEMKDRTKLAERIYYAGLNERSRFQSAIDIMRAEQMITQEIYNEMKSMLDSKEQLALSVRKDLDTKKMEELEAERQAIIKRVQEWTDRMNELKKNNS